MVLGKEIAKEEHLGQDFVRLVLSCHQKRESLQTRMSSNIKMKNGLTIISGVLSLLSALTLTAVIVRNLPYEILSVLALVMTFFGGLCALANGFIFNQREFVNLHIGAAKFLDLREKASAVALNTTIKYETRRARLSDLQREYADLSASYDHYAKEVNPPTSPIFQLGYEIAVHHLGRERYQEHEKETIDKFLQTLKQSRPPD